MDYVGPVYMRLGRFDVPDIYKNGMDFEIGKANRLASGKDVSIFALGDMVYESLLAAELLEAEGISASVIDMHTVKPIDKQMIIEEAKKTGAVVTAEDHSIIGGLGSAVCEVLSENCPVKCVRVGINDKFGKSGSKAALAIEYGLNSKEISKAAKKAIAGK
jgi:transketolase